VYYLLIAVYNVGCKEGVVSTIQGEERTFITDRPLCSCEEYNVCAYM